MRVGVGEVIPAFPTGVGVIRVAAMVISELRGVPHRRGGDPQGLVRQSVDDERSPQAWG